MKVGDVSVIVFEEKIFEEVWNQACADYVASQADDDDRELAGQHCEAASAILAHAMGLLEFRVTPPSGAAS